MPLRRLNTPQMSPLHAELKRGESAAPAPTRSWPERPGPGRHPQALWLGVRAGATMPPKCAARWTMQRGWSAPRPRPCRPWPKNSGRGARPGRHHDGHHAEQSIGAARTRRAGCVQGPRSRVDVPDPRRSRGGGRHHPHFRCRRGWWPSMPRSRPSTRGDAGRGFWRGGRCHPVARRPPRPVQGHRLGHRPLQTRIDHFSARWSGATTPSREVHAARAVETEVTAYRHSAGQSAHQVEALNARPSSWSPGGGRGSARVQRWPPRAVTASSSLREDPIEADRKQRRGRGRRVHPPGPGRGDIAALFEESLRSNAISEADLFDEKLPAHRGHQPAQVLTRLPAADRPPAARGARARGQANLRSFCIAADRNGYIATHNKKYCHPQRKATRSEHGQQPLPPHLHDRIGPCLGAQHQSPSCCRPTGATWAAVSSSRRSRRAHRGERRHWGGLAPGVQL